MRILVGFIWDGKSGGIDAYLMAFARVARDEGVNLDFLTNEYCEDLANELDHLGHRLHEIATLHDRGSQRSTIFALCEENTYDAAYFNISTALMYPVVKDAKDAGIPRIAVHSHATGSNQPSAWREIVFDLLNYVMRGRLRKATTHPFTCSNAAAEWLFGEGCEPEGSVVFVPNPVDVSIFKFDQQSRAAVRERLGLADKLVIGSVTAMKEVKNPWLLVGLFAEFAKDHPDAHLLVMGGGDLFPAVEEYATSVLRPGSFSLLGKRHDIPNLLQALDAFVLTSKREGMPISVLEAQVAGLPCLLSTGIPRDVVVEGSCVSRMKKGSSAKDWAVELSRLISNFDAKNRKSLASEVEQAGFRADSPRMILDRLRG